MRKKILPLALFTVAITALGVAAVSVANAVTTTPAPTSIVRHEPLKVDDPAGHDAGDDGSSTTVDDTGDTLVGSDDPAGHDAGDDKGGSTATSDDPVGHDAGDDNGGTTATSDDPSGHDSGDDGTSTTIDDHSGSGGDTSGSGSDSFSPK